MINTKDISQHQIIGRLSRFLSSDDLNYAEGICNGLVFIAMEYFFLNKKDEFFKDLERFLRKDDLNQFDLMLTWILILFLPSAFSFDLTQQDAYQLLHPKPICHFSFGMVMSKKNWARLFNQLNLRDNEVMHVASINHVVMITKKNNQYYLYDPNCSAGEIHYSNASNLVDGLSWAFEDYPLLTHQLAMTVKILVAAHGPEIRRDASRFYEDFRDEINSEVILNHQAYDGFRFSIMANQPDCLKIYQDKVSVDTLSWAIAYGADLVVQQLLSDGSFPDEIMQKNLMLALQCGRFTIFNEFLKNHEFHQQFMTILVPNCKQVLIDNAIQGGNVDLFRQILTICDQDKTPGCGLVDALKLRRYPAPSRASLLVKKAIESPQIEILTDLLKYFIEKKIKLNEFEIKALTLVAIKKNHLPALIKIIEFSDNLQLSQLRLSIEMIYFCSQAMILFLKEKGVQLTPWQEYCLKAKNSDVLSFVFSVFIHCLVMMRFLFGFEKKNGLYFDETPDIDESSMRLIPVPP